MRRLVLLLLLSTLSLSAQESSPKVYFIYNASGTLGGELNYLYGKLFQDEHCELCDITHNALSAKPEWKEWIASLSCENYVLHTNEATELGIDFSSFTLPVVLVDKGQGLEVLVSKDEMAKAGNDVRAFSRLFLLKMEEKEVQCE